MIKICNNDLCTGCSVCSHICPNNAISMKESEDGFLYPKIDNGLCTNCGLCKKRCPINNSNVNIDKHLEYIAITEDNIRKISSSGGAFRVLADYVLDLNGYVCGAVFNENMEVEHILSNNIKDILRMSGSKYVQSNLKNCYSEIKEKLENNITILFSGCPCQVAGLKQYLNKYYHNLLTVDLICHGVPSPMVLKKYLEEEYSNEKIISINFRDKKESWSSPYITITTDKNIYSQNFSENAFTKAFSYNMILRKSCYNCKYAQKNRVGDFTIGDAWGAKNICDQKGHSVLFLNNNKSKSLVNYLQSKFKKIEQIENYFQPQLSYPVSEHPARKEFFEKIKTKTLKETLEETFCNKKNVAILNYFWENLNFGAVLTAYSLNKACSDLGYNAQNINYKPAFYETNDLPVNKNFDNFRKKYLKLTNPINSEFDFKHLNETFHNFIVGSDQVWRYSFIRHDNMEHYFLNFANPEKNIIAYAASFGVYDIESDVQEVKDFYKYYISNFNSVSLREENGVDFCKQMGINSSLVLDPVFLQTKDEWKIIIEDYSSYKKHKIAFYNLSDNEDSDIINLSKKIITDIKDEDCIKLMSTDIDISQWLWQIENCDFFITNSFHGVCFAIIFNKPFVCINSNIQASARMESLFKKLGIKDKLYSNYDEVDIASVEKPLNYDEINQKLSKLKDESLEWLKNSLNSSTEDFIYKKITTKNKIKEIIAENAKNSIKSVHKKYLIYSIKHRLSFGKNKERYEHKKKKFKDDYKKLKDIIRIQYD